MGTSLYVSQLPSDTERALSLFMKSKHCVSLAGAETLKTSPWSRAGRAELSSQRGPPGPRASSLPCCAIIELSQTCAVLTAVLDPS